MAAGSPPAGQTCANCKFMIIKNPGAKQYQECHCNPPDSMAHRGNWPRVQPADWCGHWTAAT